MHVRWEITKPIQSSAY